MASWEEQEREIREQAMLAETGRISDALNRIAAGIEAHTAAIHRLADVYLYCNDPEPEGEQHSGLGGSLSDAR